MALVPDPEATFRSLTPARDELLEQLEKEAEKESVPIIGPVVGGLLYLLARAVRARNVLELGTATGYSAIHLARACAAEGGRLITLEYNEEMAGRARANLKKAGLADCAEVVSGDALEILATLNGPFDLIFLDIEKRDYARCLPLCEKLLRPQGVLVADNTAFEDAQDFNQALAESPAWNAVQLYAYLPFHSPDHDGLCLALRVD
ncbi:MAG: O-methyltransferase [Planctomycetota bacterium]|jgi:predicted O-methyltransferase YrrM